MAKEDGSDNKSLFGRLQNLVKRNDDSSKSSGNDDKKEASNVGEKSEGDHLPVDESERLPEDKRKQFRVGNTKFGKVPLSTKKDKFSIGVVNIGGTQSSVGFAHKYFPFLTSSQVLSGLERLGLKPHNTALKGYDVFEKSIDSINLNFEGMCKVRKKILDVYKNHNAIVVTTGTDSMADLGFFLRATLPPEVLASTKVILTGAMAPGVLLDPEKSNTREEILQQLAKVVGAEEAKQFSEEYTTELIKFKKLEDGSRKASLEQEEAGREKAEPEASQRLESVEEESPAKSASKKTSLANLIPLPSTSRLRGKQEESDALKNISRALLLAASDQLGGRVSIVMNKSDIFDPPYVSKENTTDIKAFEAVVDGPVGKIKNSKPTIHYIPGVPKKTFHELFEDTGSKLPSPSSNAQGSSTHPDDIQFEITVVKTENEGKKTESENIHIPKLPTVPTIDCNAPNDDAAIELLREYFRPRAELEGRSKYDTVILVGTGNGNLPDVVKDEVKKWTDAGKICVRTSQASKGEVGHRETVDDEAIGTVCTGKLRKGAVTLWTRLAKADAQRKGKILDKKSLDGAFKEFVTDVAAKKTIQKSQTKKLK